MLAAFVVAPVVLAGVVGCAGGRSNGPEQIAPSAAKGVATSAPSRAEQLVLPVRRYYVRWTPGSNQPPVRILRTRRLQATYIAGGGGGRISWLYRNPRTFGVSVRSVSNTGRHRVTLVRRLSAYTTGLTATRRHVYWGGSGRIGRVAVDGSRVQRRWLLAGQDGLATDGRYLYLSQCNRDRIGRVPLASRARHRRVEWIVRGNITCPQALAVSGGFVYWSGFTRSGAGPGVIGRAPAAGGAPDGTWTNIRAFSGPYSLVVVNGFVYWRWNGTAGRRPCFLGRVSVDGSRFTRKFREIRCLPFTATTR